MTTAAQTHDEATVAPAVGTLLDRRVRRLATMGEPYGPCNYGSALIDAVRRYGAGEASFACHGCIDAPQQIACGGLTAAWWEWSTWSGPEGGTLKINTVSRDA